MADHDPQDRHGPLRGRVAVVTGAARGIGLAVAEAAHAAGAEVWMVARSAAVLASEAARLGSGAIPFPADLTVDADRGRLVEAVQRSSGRLDLLVHSAGTIRLGPVADVPVETFREQLESNLIAAYGLTRAALDLLVAVGGDVVVIGSSAGRAPGTADKSAYAASHHGLRVFADSLRSEVNALGVRVTVVLPGQTATGRQQALHAAAGRDYRPDELLQPADVASVALFAVLLPRTAELTEASVRPRLKPRS